VVDIERARTSVLDFLEDMKQPFAGRARNWLRTNRLTPPALGRTLVKQARCSLTDSGSMVFRVQDL